MAVQIDVEYTQIIPSSRSVADTHAFLADFERAIRPHFPGLVGFEAMSPDTFKWKFETVKYAGYEFQITFTTRFEVSPSHIKLHPVPVKGESQLRGGWEIKPKGTSSEVHFQTKLTLELPLPFFAKSMAQPITQKEISKLFERYSQNVGKALSA